MLTTKVFQNEIQLAVCLERIVQVNYKWMLYAMRDREK